MLALYIFLSSAAQLKSFIVGGSFASIYEYPHSAFLMVRCVNDNTQYYICGSSILNQRIVLTAAHCINLCESGTSISINMGHEHQKNGTVISAKRFLWHGWYDSYTLANDIGMVKMSQPVKFSENIARVAIMRNPPYNEPAMITGWGQTSIQTRTRTLFLRQVDKKLLRKAECELEIGSMPRGTFCARNDDWGHHIASGDSGSSLVVRGYIQIGLVSGYRPAIDRNIGIYTDVGYFYDWIRHNAHELYCGIAPEA